MAAFQLSGFRMVLFFFWQGISWNVSLHISSKLLLEGFASALKVGAQSRRGGGQGYGEERAVVICGERRFRKEWAS
jgi:hypothetical protein